MASNEGFSSLFWGWYGQDEHARVLEICMAIRGLDFLAMTPDQKREAIPACPACETWSETMLPLDALLCDHPSVLPVEIRQALAQAWALCNDLPEPAFRCHDWFIFDHEAWLPLVLLSKKILEMMEAQLLRPHLEEVAAYCRNAIRGIKPSKG